MLVAARRVSRLLAATDQKVVFAESCTGGLVSATLTRIPGISNYHCGGVVVYRNQTKTAYLGIPTNLLDDVGPVSAEVAEAMAARVLTKTPEAHVAASVTGHLGPGAPPRLDGLAYVGIARRVAKRAPPEVTIKQLRCRRADSRAVRQRWVVKRVLELLADFLEHKHLQ